MASPRNEKQGTVRWNVASVGYATFLKLALKKHDRRQTPQDQSMGVKRKDERYFDPVDKVLQEFKNIHGLSFSSLRELYRRTRRK